MAESGFPGVFFGFSLAANGLEKSGKKMEAGKNAA